MQGSSPVVVRVEVFRLQIPLHEPFQIALQSTAVADNVFVRLQSADGLQGWGEASPLHAVTGETPGTCLAAAEFLGARLLGHDASEVRERGTEMVAALPHNSAIRAAFEMALYDLAARSAGMPLYRYLGGSVRELVTDVTLGIDEPVATAEKARKAVQETGFRHLKMKLGLSSERDVQAVREVRRAVGPKVRLRLDANQAWGRQEAVEMLGQLASFDVQFCEQPVSKDDVAGLTFVSDRSPVPVMADEAVFGASDLLALASIPFINLKLAKTGGIGPLLKADAVAATLGLRSMLGCMMESRLGLTASAHVALACESVRFLDLDTHFELAQDPVIGGIRYEGDRILLPEAPGLGATLDERVLTEGPVLLIE